MNVSLTPELEELVNLKVRSGLYQTASEVVREALRLLKQRDDEARRIEQQMQQMAGMTPAPMPPGTGQTSRGTRRRRVKR
jgi:antitoxin ParD1/3/4